MTGSEALSVMNATRDNDGYGMDGYGAWFWIIIILFFAWGGNGLGNNNQENIDTRFIERDIFSTNQNVSTTSADINSNVCNTKYDLGTEILENRYASQLGDCSINRNLDSVRYDNLLTAKDIQAQMAECCCNLRAEGLANTQKILDKMCETEVNQLRTDLQSAQLQISQLSQTQNIEGYINQYVIPRSVPAYLTCSPYMSSYYAYNGYNGYNGCGCN
jgi:hypothetical protein